METYGYVYKEMYKKGAASVMVRHIALPAVEDEIDPNLGPKPRLVMVGACAVCPLDRLSIEFINAGGDMILFALENDFYYLKDAVLRGEISMERLRDAVRHILKMKDQARLFEDQMHHMHITQNFVNAILKDEPLIAPGLNGINEVDICNAVHMSAWIGQTVELPVNPDTFCKMLQEKIKESEKES